MSCEVSWFSALCDDDYEFLGQAEPGLQSSWPHCRDIALMAESAGYDNLLLPSGYTLGIDSVAFAAAIAPLLKRMQLRSAGNVRQRELRDSADTDGYVDPNLWTGIGRARSGAGAAIVGDPDQVLAKLRSYQELGLDAFILSGYPHLAEGDLFARHVLTQLSHGPLPRRAQQRSAADV